MAAADNVIVLIFGGGTMDEMIKKRARCYLMDTTSMENFFMRSKLFDILQALVNFDGGEL